MTKKKSALSGASIAEFYSKYGALLILALVFIVGSIFVPRFLSGDNILSIFNQVSIIAVLSCGMSFIIISGNADLQAGSAIALLSCICAVMMKTVGNPVIAFVVTILCGILFYAFSGYFVSYLGLPAFIVTLAMQMALRGAAYLVADGAPVLGVGGIAKLATGKLLGVPMLLIIQHRIWPVCLCDWRQPRSGRGIRYQREEAYLPDLPAGRRNLRHVRHPVRCTHEQRPARWCNVLRI